MCASIRFGPGRPVPHAGSAAPLQPATGVGAEAVIHTAYPYGVVKRPVKPEYTPLFDGNRELEASGPKLCMRMADGKGHLEPMDPEAQKLMFRAVANVAQSAMSSKDCKKIVGFFPERDGIRFVLNEGKNNPYGEKFIRYETDIAERDPLIQQGEDVLRDFVQACRRQQPPQRLENETDNDYQERQQNFNQRQFLFNWIQQRLYPEEAGGRLDPKELLDFRPRRAYREGQREDEIRASTGVKRLMYFLTLAHEGIGDGYSPHLQSTPVGQVEGEMDRIFGDKRIGEADRRRG